MGPTWPFLLMYGSYDMRHTGFRRLMVVNETPGNGASHHRTSNIVLIYHVLTKFHRTPNTMSISTMHLLVICPRAIV